MIEQTQIRGKIKRIDILTDENSESEEWMAYKIIIETDEGTWFITGYHDSSPTVEQ